MDDNSSVYEPKSKYELMYFVNARQKTYLTSTEIYLPNKPYEKLESGYEPSTKQITKQGSHLPSRGQDDSQSKQRAYTAVKDIALSNIFEMFVTFTFKSGRDDPDLCKVKMSGWLKRQRKLDKNFQYLIVSEFHKDGKSIHFHALINGYEGKVVRAINPKTGKALVKGRRKVYDFPNYTLGHGEVYYIGDLEEDRIKSGFYLTKYLRKDMPSFSNKKRYWASRGLNKPVTKDNPQEWYLAVTPDHVVDSPYGKFLYFNNKRIDIFLS
jgi:hypothetical protein